MIQSYTFTGAGRQIDALATFFRYESGEDGSGVTAVRVVADGTVLGNFEPGDSIELVAPVKRWEVYPTSSGCRGTVRLGSAKVTSNKLQGIVQVVDGAKSRSMSGSAFSAYGYQASSAGQWSCVQLWNTGTGQKNLIVNDVVAITNAAGTSAAQVSLVASALSTQILVGQSKRVYGVNSAAGVVRSQNLAVSGVNVLRTFLMVSGASQGWRPTEPIILPPGTGLNFQAVNAGVDIGASFDWWEEPV